MKVFTSGTFDPLHSGHVAFFEELFIIYGEVYVGIGNDRSVSLYKHPVYRPQEERLYMVKAIRYITDASINTGIGFIDFLDNPMFLDCKKLIVPIERDNKLLMEHCERLDIEYVLWERVHAGGLPIVSSTDLRK